jgi:hypothetical protein
MGSGLTHPRGGNGTFGTENEPVAPILLNLLEFLPQWIPRPRVQKDPKLVSAGRDLRDKAGSSQR